MINALLAAILIKGELTIVNIAEKREMKFYAKNAMKDIFY